MPGCGNPVILCVAPSTSGPHRVTKDDHFYAGTAVGKEPVDIRGIRNAFEMNASLAQQVEAFGPEALKRPFNCQSPAPQLEFPACIGHVVPVTAVTRPDGQDIATLRATASKMMAAAPSNRYLGRPTANLHCVGCIADRNADEEQTAYAQLQRNGSVELVDGALLSLWWDDREDDK